ncbi:TIGR01244 family phosphatase [Candidatus Methylopumilus rimovensis]|jgi:sulfide:quinone oxidoreductase|uniref:TIGR01244 family phosphatase n=1 Tax=Candidatus Methylopumilus rimovensis TaxID=2588535 RepID=A0AAE6FRM0_9PROT|nr:TIGR01244 family sulfur transferase [Candidatus Methylopumilus rimovensis]QDD12912.1 TIGR01244 family phosphatase [Candidatus Methylopumilus rimovensis]
MKFAKINNELTVSDQITIEDLKEIHAQGYKTIFCNRPDQESEGQLAFSLIEKEAQNLGIKAIHQPVVGGQISDVDIIQFDAYFKVAQKPVFAYCRTGTRCSTLWALSHASTLPIDDILSKTQNAGYDLSSLRDRLNALK